MRKILCFIRIGPSIIFNYFRWINKCSKNPDRLPLEERYRRLRKLIIKSFKIMKLDIKVNNINYLTQSNKNVLITCNHRFFLDPIYFIYASEKPVSFIAKKQLEKIPFLGKTIKAIDGYFIDREDLMGQMRLFKDVANRMKKGDISYLIFPEGTRMKDKDKVETLPYKDGSIKLAYWANVDIVPACMIGNEKCFDKKDKGYKRRNVGISFLKPYKISEIKDIPTTKITPEIYKNTNIELKNLYIQNQERNKK